MSLAQAIRAEFDRLIAALASQQACPDLRAFTVEEVADRLDVSVRHVRGLLASGKLRATPVGKRAVRITAADLRDFLESGA